MGMIQRKKLSLLLATRDLPGYNYYKPLGLGYLKSYVNRALPELEIEICDDIESLVRGCPDVIGISTATENFHVALDHISRLKTDPGVPILLGGIHISLMPETLPQGVIGCLGEAEDTLVELMRLLLSSGTLDPSGLRSIAGLVFHNGDGKLFRTSPRELIAELDTIPVPDRDALGMGKGNDDTLYMFTSRGCPYHCKFCVSRKHWTKYREFSAEYVLTEMAMLVKDYRVQHIHFFDDLFIVNRKRLQKIVEGYAARDFSITTSCAIRANLVDDELCGLLKKLRVTEVMFGAESFSEQVLKVLKANSVTVAQNQLAIDILHRHGIKVNITMVFDAPEETRKDLLTSWKGIFENVRSGKVNKVGWGFLRPYPGSEYWDLALQKGIVGENMDWSVFKSWHDKKFHMNENMTFEEVNQIVDEWQTKCYLANLHYRDTGKPVYVSKNNIFAAKQDLIEEICRRTEKDESDRFVEDEYRAYRGQMEKNTVPMTLGEGWESPHEGTRWVRKRATFFLDLAMSKESNLLNITCYVPSLENYQGREQTITVEINGQRSGITVNEEGLHTITVPLRSSLLKRTLSGMIVCNNDFVPSQVGSSADTRSLAIVVSRVELARDEPQNITGRIVILE